MNALTRSSFATAKYKVRWIVIITKCDTVYYFASVQSANNITNCDSTPVHGHGGEKALHLRKCRLKPGCHKNDSLYTDVVLFFFSFFSKTSASEATERERKIKNVCSHLWEKRRFILKVPPQCQRVLIITSAFAVPIKLDQWNWRYKLLV